MKVEVEETRKFKDAESNKDDLFNQVDLKVEKEDIIKKDFYLGPLKSKTFRRVGNTFMVCNKSGIPVIVIGPHCIISII